MKVAGTLLAIIGFGLAAITFMFQNDTGKSSPLELLIGIALGIIGIVLINTKPKDKKNKNENQN